MRLRYIMNKLIQYIEKYDTISIFRHVHPDGDALGSQWGIATFIKEHYPNKTVYVVGDNPEFGDFFPKSEVVSIEEIKHSYAIVLDSATETRVDGPFKEAKRVLNIDHHPNKSPYGDEYLVDETRSSTCEIVAELLIEKAPLSKTNANYLLAGILTDTIRFMIENTKPETLEVAAKLMRFGANINDLSRHFFNGTYDSFKIRTYLSNHVEYEGQLATLTITKAMRETLNISERVAKSYYTVMSGVSEFWVYAVFVETEEGHYIGSLRSQEVTINNICEKYHGGGHRLACGVNYLTQDQLPMIKEDLLQAIIDYQKL